MRTSAAGSRPHDPGFTLVELLVVIAIVALATAGVSLALRDTRADALEREAVRLAALLEAGRAQSRMSGVPVRWSGGAAGFRFDGLDAAPRPGRWLDTGTAVVGEAVLLLGPEPLISPQQVVLVSRELPGQAVRVATDGLHPFTVQRVQ
ncbi:prepilin-type N-terminal cleavage/methylation domain-containing protein [Xylophilus sp.]|uniref:prepilin-type N-terminal cleavage/methylation domain-containing protein n=1 Tax=Xylophilus sp. TaxID=2653893 RepID=UPI0013B941F3|nr:prepilin-type N-terminal cleavage/methylation domain-containing protein [Xylophilus sp.]KAF1049813.1 MAG: hypothetical protein GAK38_00476 [Xylophilus sp.]